MGRITAKVCWFFVLVCLLVCGGWMDKKCLAPIDRVTTDAFSYTHTCVQTHVHAGHQGRGPRPGVRADSGPAAATTVEVSRLSVWWRIACIYSVYVGVSMRVRWICPHSTTCTTHMYAHALYNTPTYPLPHPLHFTTLHTSQHKTNAAGRTRRWGSAPT